MELSFKLFFLVLTLVSAQNTTDYDYETTTIEETSTDNITELPVSTTTLKVILSTELPLEQSIKVSDFKQNLNVEGSFSCILQKSQIENISDSGTCPCDLKIDECDINCCCDVDCTKQMITAFDCLSNVNYVAKESVCHRKGGWFCVLRELDEKVEVCIYICSRKDVETIGINFRLTMKT